MSARAGRVLRRCEAGPDCLYVSFAEQVHACAWLLNVCSATLGGPSDIRNAVAQDVDMTSQILFRSRERERDATAADPDGLRAPRVSLCEGALRTRGWVVHVLIFLRLLRTAPVAAPHGSRLPASLVLVVDDEPP